MPKRKDGRRMTLSEHLALRAQAADEERAREEQRQRQLRSLKALDWGPSCTCPACRRLRQGS